MKKMIILLMAAVMIFSSNVMAQNVQTEQTTKEVVVTNYKYKDSKGVEYAVHKGSRGGYYIIRTSKNTGKQYKQYLTDEQKQKLNIK